MVSRYTCGFAKVNIAAIEKLVEKHPHVIVLNDIDINNKNIGEII